METTFSAATVDNVTPSNTLEHIPNTEHLLQECARVLKPGGLILGTIPFLLPVHQAPYDFNRYTNFQLTKFLQDAGFHNVIVEPLGEPHMAVCLGRLGESRPDAQHVIVRRRDTVDTVAEELAQLPLDPVSNHRVPDLARDSEPKARVAVALFAVEPVERQKACRHRPAAAVDMVEVARASEAIPALHRLQAERCFRPLARRRLRIRRPARVDMRARKPCLRFRLRTFG